MAGFTFEREAVIVNIACFIWTACGKKASQFQNRKHIRPSWNCPPETKTPPSPEAFLFPNFTFSIFRFFS
jgi:hypothetical protein